jgi:hypothetical protein
LGLSSYDVEMVTVHIANAYSDDILVVVVKSGSLVCDFEIGVTSFVTCCDEANHIRILHTVTMELIIIFQIVGQVYQCLVYVCIVAWEVRRTMLGEFKYSLF